MDVKIVQVALNGLENILRLGEQDCKGHGGTNPYAVMIEQCFGKFVITYGYLLLIGNQRKYLKLSTGSFWKDMDNFITALCNYIFDHQNRFGQNRISSEP